MQGSKPAKKPADKKEPEDQTKQVPIKEPGQTKTVPEKDPQPDKTPRQAPTDTDSKSNGHVECA